MQVMDHRSHSLNKTLFFLFVQFLDLEINCHTLAPSYPFAFALASPTPLASRCVEMNRIK